MARSMGGCNKQYENVLKPQGTMRETPRKFARNNLAKGGVNTMMANSGKTGMGTSFKGKGTSGTSKA